VYIPSMETNKTANSKYESMKLLKNRQKEMQLGKTLYVTERMAWRSWLAKNHDKENEIWLVYFRKSSHRRRISYNDAVEEALCYGWIDSNVKGMDDECFAQRFSPRKPTSNLSQMNRERIRQLTAKKKMTKAGLAAVAHVFCPAKEEKFIIPKDILEAIKKDKQAWHHFRRFPKSYKRIRIAYIEHARRRGVEPFQRSLQNFIRLTAKNKRFGFVKEMY
jgi:uncharacterized protein YdeI (YjbR/CyaY-like superfamily)